MKIVKLCYSTSAGVSENIKKAIFNIYLPKRIIQLRILKQQNLIW